MENNIIEKPLVKIGYSKDNSNRLNYSFMHEDVSCLSIEQKFDLLSCIKDLENRIMQKVLIDLAVK